MQKLIRVLTITTFTFVLSLAVVITARAEKPSDVGFDDAGYNDNANLFNGTVMDWCMDKIGDQTYCDTYYGYWGNDKLIMKWNNEWNRGNEEGWSDPDGYGAWLSNEYNGAYPDASGETWHYKIVWVGDYVSDPSLLPEGSYGIWGQFAVIMDHGVFGHEHMIFAHGMPTGYGAY